MDNLPTTPRPSWALAEASDDQTWRSRVTEIRSLDPAFAPVGVMLRQVRTNGAEPHVVISSVFADIPASLNQAEALSHRLHTLVREAGGAV